MNKDEAQQTLAGIFALEAKRGSLTAQETEVFNKAISTQAPADVAEVAKIYAGRGAKLSLSAHDATQIALACEALSVKNGKEKKNGKAKKPAK